LRRLKITKRLEELFNLPLSQQDDQEDTTGTSDLTDQDRAMISEIDATIDKIDAALPMVRNIESSDKELDALAAKSLETFEDLMSLGMNVDSRFCAEIFSVAQSMMGHALTAKQAKLNNKFKMLDLQIKKARLDQEAKKIASATGQAEVAETATGQVLSRNDLLDLISGVRGETSNLQTEKKA
jgi:hypothetical protein